MATSISGVNNRMLNGEFGEEISGGGLEYSRHAGVFFNDPVENGTPEFPVQRSQEIQRLLIFSR